MELNNLYNLVERGVELFNDKPALVKKENNEWHEISWQELKNTINNISKGLISLGLNKSNTVCILSNTRAEWPLIDLGIISAGGITVPIYHSNTGSQCEYIINDSETRFIFIEDQTQFDKISEIKSKIRSVTKIIAISNDVKSDNILSLSELIEIGKKSDNTEFDKRISKLLPSDIATIVYTSGTTGLPKGTVITHDNFIAQVLAVTKALPFLTGLDTICFLPLAHVFARSAQFTHMYNGMTQWFAESLEKLSENLIDAKPQVFTGVPRVLEKVYAKINETVQKSGGLKQKLFNWSLNVGQKVSQLTQKKTNIPFGLILKYKIANILVFKKIKDKFGGKLQVVICGGAPLSNTISDFFHSVGILILEGYGLTETTSATHVNRIDNFKFGTVGMPLDGVKVKLADDNEILIKSKTCMLGYYKNIEHTKKTLDDDNWYQTGDIGKIDSEGFLKIIDRKKDIIITSGGKNISPQYIENLLKSSSFINEAMAYGDKRNFLSALIVTDFDAIKEWANDKSIKYKSIIDLVRKSEVIQLIDEEIDKINKQLPPYETIKKFALIEKEFTIESGELTPSLKLKRNVIVKNYQKFLDQFYKERYN